MASRISFCLIAFFALEALGSNPVVRIPNGVLQGTWQVSTNGRNYASFQGVPYARPPVGKYRFREPQPMKPWLGVWDASKPLAECMQYEPFQKKIVGSENCLYVNVHTPKLNAGALLPVVVFIHGGAFMYGSGGLYDASHLMDRDMVVVTLNYRLGPLGFLSTGDEVIPGNAGLKDQSLALQWVKHNIMMFGGNPDSITLTGCSAGGASVHYHYLSPMSRDTFHRGIAFSGSAFASWTYATKPAEKAHSLAAILGCPTTTSKEMAECLKNRPAEAVVNAQAEMFEWKVHMFTPFTPTRESRRTKNPFLVKYPFDAAIARDMQQLPLITSVTSEEGLYPAAVYQTDPALLKELDSHWEQLASNIFEYNDTLPVDSRSSVAVKIKQKYLEGKPIGQETFRQLVQALGDRLFYVDVGKLAELHATRTRMPTYLYRFSYRGEMSLSNFMARNQENYGVSHADDVLLLFKFFRNAEVSNSSGSSTPQMRELLIDMLHSYASKGMPKVGHTQWLPIVAGSSELRYLEIASPTDVTMKSSSDFGNRRFWDSLGFDENENFEVSLRDEL